MAEIIRIDNNTWRIEDGFVRFFLLEGMERAVLIDSGVNCPDATDIAGKLTDKPVILLNTHGDADHTSGTAAFDYIHIHPADYVECGVKDRYPNTGMAEIKDGDIIDLGERPLKILHIPGHTKGSVAILDTAKRVLYTGDSVQNGHIFMFGAKRCPEQFEKSLDKIIALQSEYDCIYASHNDYRLPADYPQKVKEAWSQIKLEDAVYEMTDVHGNLVKSYTTFACGFYTE